MQVLKFGGSSVANAENINKVTAIVKDKIKKETNNHKLLITLAFISNGDK